MFRFTIRDVLWLTVVVALGCGWWLQWHSQHDALHAERNKLKWQLKSTAYLLEQQNIKLDAGDTKVEISGAVRSGIVVTSVELIPGTIVQ